MDSRSVKVSSSYVYKSHKLVEDSGNGEAKIYVGQRTDKSLEEFFNKYSEKNNFFMRIDDIKEYFQDSIVEYSPSRNSKYKQANYDGISENIHNINALSEKANEGIVNVDIELFRDSARVYFKILDKDISKWIRTMLFPKCSDIVFYKAESDSFLIKFIYTTENETVENKAENVVGKKGENVIFYGAPGTGKSHDLQEYIRVFEGMENYENSKAAPNVFRVTLHPEYDYSDFVGQLLPETRDGVVTYEYRAGVFAKSLDYALKHPNEYTFMILEEMSRANVAAVFGDLFQLLDRDENGRSEYVVNNPMLAKLVYGTESEEQAIYIPANLNIIGTVNTSDQNVFAMDTAFKRRFRWVYKSTNVDETSFKNNPQLEWTKGKKVSWYNFYTTLNDYITETLGLSEDKQIGPYFIKFNEQQDSHVLLQDKLLQYLWEDVENVARNNFSNEKTLFDKKIGSFSKLYDKFSAYENIFSEDLSKELSSKATIVEHAVGQVEDTISDNPDF